MKRVLAILVVLTAVLTGAATAEESENPQAPPPYSPDFLDDIFHLLPQSVGEPLFDLRRTILRLTERPDPSAGLQKIPSQIKEENPYLTVSEFGPRPGDGKAIFEIGGYKIRGNLKFGLDPRLFDEPRPSNADAALPANPSEEPRKFDVWNFPDYYKDVQTRIFIAIEF